MDIKLIGWFSILVLMRYMLITWILVPLMMSSTHLHGGLFLQKAFKNLQILSLNAYVSRVC